MVGGLFGRMPQARYARLTGAATHPAGARRSKCIIIISVRLMSEREKRYLRILHISVSQLTTTEGISIL
jgi:hypothetical protein